MFEVKRGNSLIIKKLRELSDKVFRPGVKPGTLMFREFPSLFSEGNSYNIYYISDDRGEPVSMIGVKPWKIKIYGSTVSAIAIGSVCTLPEYRNKGLASKILEKVIEDFSKDTSVMLVSGELNIYRRVGCVNFGPLYRIVYTPINREQVTYKTPEGFEIQALLPEEVNVEELYKLYISEPITYLRTLDEMKDALHKLKSPRYMSNPCPVPIFIATDSRDNIVAYASPLLRYSQGSLSVYVNEWAGKRPAILRILKYVGRWFNADQVYIKVQPTDKEMIDLAKIEGLGIINDKNQGTIRILNLKLLLTELSKYFELERGIKLKVEEVSKEEWRIEISYKEEKREIILKGYDNLTTWFFNEPGLGVPFPSTDDLSFI